MCPVPFSQSQPRFGARFRRVCVRPWPRDLWPRDPVWLRDPPWPDDPVWPRENVARRPLGRSSRDGGRRAEVKVTQGSEVDEYADPRCRSPRGECGTPSPRWVNPTHPMPPPSPPHHSQSPHPIHHPPCHLPPLCQPPIQIPPPYPLPQPHANPLSQSPHPSYHPNSLPHPDANLLSPTDLM